MASLLLLRLSAFLVFMFDVVGYTIPMVSWDSTSKDAKVLILGGGVAGITAARTLSEQGITDFIIIEARDELGGRMRSHKFGTPTNQYTTEVGANWIQGTQRGSGPENPILNLAKKHNVTTQYNDCFGSLSAFLLALNSATPKAH